MDEETLSMLRKLVIAMVIILLVGVIMWSQVSTIKLWIDELGKKYKPPELQFTNNFQITATYVGIAGAVPTCANSGNTYECPVNTVVNFKVGVYNGGIKQKDIRGSPKACPDTADCTTNIFTIGPSGNQCIVIQGETKECDGASYQFTKPGRYKVFAGAECILDPQYGCMDPTQTTPTRSDNPNNWITIIIS